MKATRKLTADQQFFFDNAGYSYSPGKESKALGRTRCAVALAAAEAHGREQGWAVEWEQEQEIDLSWMTDEERAQPHEVLCAVLLDSAGKVLDSLGNIVDPSREYGRVVEAELCAGAMVEVQS